MYISQTKLEVPLQHYPMFHIDLMSNKQHRVKGKGHFRRFKLLLGRIFLCFIGLTDKTNNFI